MTYHSEIWADKAGYYIYLPSAAIHHFNLQSFPDSISNKTGLGFVTDYSQHKIKTKYTYGVALLESPFFFATLICSKFQGVKSTGFEKIFGRSIDVASAFYLTLGLSLFFQILLMVINWKKALVLTITVAFGTNLYYFGLFETGMSHTYSFFAFNLYLLTFLRIIQVGQSFKRLLVLGISIGLISIIRPFNIVFLPFPFIVAIVMKKITIVQILKMGTSPILLIPFLILITPQLIYWKYAFGSFISYSYGNEGFNNIYDPKLLRFWFSTNNGLFAYTPLWILFLAAAAFVKYPLKLKVIYFSFFVASSYLLASWWSWHYGCSFGCRPFVELIPFFALPLAIYWNTKNNSILIPALSILFIGLNLKMSYTYGGCWPFGDWNWTEFKNLLTNPTL